MAAGVGAPGPRSPTGIFEILAVLLRPPRAHSSPTLPLLQGGSASSELSFAYQSAVSRWIYGPKQRLAGSLPRSSGRWQRCADRFARIGPLEQKATTMR